MSQKNIAIIGVGSPWAADKVGELVIEKLKRLYAFGCENCYANLAYYDRPSIILLEKIKVFDEVHLIDALLSVGPAGQVCHFNDVDVFEQAGLPLSSHAIGLAQVLSLGKVLGSLPNKLMIHAITIQAATLMQSSQIQQASDRLVQFIQHCVLER